MRGRKRAVVGALLILIGAFWWFSRPVPLSEEDLPDHLPDPANGERIFHAGGCASCHAAPGAEGRDRDVLSGGLMLDSPYGVFSVPNISPGMKHGIGDWEPLDFANAMLRGISPAGRHYFPSFPYTSYARMSISDVLDLKAFLDTLPASDQENAPHQMVFPFGFRRALGIWKRLYLDQNFVMAIDQEDALLERGRYLVEGPGHCGACHTPRNRVGAPRLDQWLSGAPVMEGEGRVPDITAQGLADWSEGDIGFYLETGMDPDFDVVGGDMVKVQENMARLPAEDRQAIAAYLKRVGTGAH